MDIDVSKFSYWIIRHKPTGKWLPNVPRQQSWQEPQFYLAPRLFEKRSSAATALGLWLKGRARAATGTEDDYFGSQYTVQTGVDYTPVDTRKREDMEIVEVRLTEIDHGIR